MTEGNDLLILIVEIRVKPGTEAAFARATLDNARNSVQEPGVVRFDVMQDREDSTRYRLIEVYRDQAAAAAHKQTAHYAAWYAAVADLMAEPRQRHQLVNLFPDNSGW